MTLKEFFKGIPQRMQWRLNYLTGFEFLYIVSIPFMVIYADPSLFVEGAWVENLQLIVLAVAFVLALQSPRDKKMYTALALLIILMLMRETNLGRAYFCEKYLSPDEICRWKKMKYGVFVEPLRDLYGLYILYYIWRQKVYATVWQYVLKAPLFVWDLFVLVGAAVVATLAEWPQIDNEVLEESCEMLFYLAFTNCIWRYSQKTAL